MKNRVSGGSHQTYLRQTYALPGLAGEIFGDDDGQRCAGEKEIALIEEDKVHPKVEPLIGCIWFNADRAEWKCGDFKKARQYYERLIADFPNVRHVFAARFALKHMDEMKKKYRR